MTTKQRAVRAMHQEGLSFREIGSVLGISKHAAWRIFCRASNHSE